LLNQDMPMPELFGSWNITHVADFVKRF